MGPIGDLLAAVAVVLCLATALSMSVESDEGESWWCAAFIDVTSLGKLTAFTQAFVSTFLP